MNNKASGSALPSSIKIFCGGTASGNPDGPIY